MFCNNCGSQMVEGNAFCTYCGSLIQAPTRGGLGAYFHAYLRRILQAHKVKKSLA